MLAKGATPTFLDHKFANRVLKLLNALVRLQVAPAGAGRIVVTEDSIILDLSALSAAQQAASLAAIQKTQAAQQAQINALISSLKNATITATCNPLDSTISIKITFPKLP